MAGPQDLLDQHGRRTAHKNIRFQPRAVDGCRKAHELFAAGSQNQFPHAGCEVADADARKADDIHDLQAGAGLAGKRQGPLQRGMRCGRRIDINQDALE